MPAGRSRSSSCIACRTTRIAPKNFCIVQQIVANAHRTLGSLSQRATRSPPNRSGLLLVLLLICARRRCQADGGGGAWGWLVVRVGCARTPSLISVLDPGWLRVGDMMVDGVFRDAVRPLDL